MRLILSLSMLFLAGCGSGITQVTQPEDARSLCRLWLGGSNPDIEASIDGIFIGYRQDRLNGFSQAELVLTAQNFCIDNNQTYCSACILGIIEEVFNE